jgi:sulfopyruvate decarboxylase subunit beta
MALDRYEWLRRLAGCLPEDGLILAYGVGAIGAEWAQLTKEHPRTAMIGQMGDVVGLAVGLSLALPHRRVICIDGDGSLLMELGQLILLGQQSPANLIVFVVDNRIYETTGAQPTATAARADLAVIARGAGVPHTADVRTMSELEEELENAFDGRNCRFINVRTKPGMSEAPPRQIDGFEDKFRFVRYVEKVEGITILNLAQQDRELMREPK